MTEQDRSVRHHYHTSRKELWIHQIKKDTSNRHQVQLQDTVIVLIILGWKIYRLLAAVIMI